MAGWGKLVAGALIGVAGTVYATNEELRKKLPGAVRDFPDRVSQRVKDAVSAGRAASTERRQEILRDLDRHGGGHHAERGIQPDPDQASPESPEETGEAPADEGNTTEAQPDAPPESAGRGKQNE